MGVMPSRRGGTARPGAGLRLLTTLGDVADLAVLASVATAHRFDLQVCADVGELVEQADGGEFDAAVFDLRLPAANAYDVCAELKAGRRTADMTVILTTTAVDASACKLAMAAGCDELIEKPINRHRLAMSLLSFARARRTWSEQSRHILVALSRLVEARARGVGRRSERLARLCRDFGLALELDRGELEALELAATLHDVGEIALPDAILRKRGRLTAEELELVRRQTEIGASLLEPLAETNHLVSIVRHHHERWDGGGYPDGLGGSAIPRLARVFRIIDTADAHLGGRAGGAAHGLRETVGRLHAEADAGALDPELCLRFVAWLTARRGLTGTGA